MSDVVERCRKGSCKRHNACMYAPCFATPLFRPNLTAKPADQFLTENNEILRAEIQRLRAEQASSYAKGWNDAMAAAAELNTAELAEARAKAFEEAAKVAEGEKCSDAIVAAENIAGSGDAWLVNHICDEIAQSIRAMIDKEASMEGVGG